MSSTITSTSEPLSSPEPSITTSCTNAADTENATIRTTSTHKSTVTKHTRLPPAITYTTETRQLPNVADASFPDPWMTATGAALAALNKQRHNCTRSTDSTDTMSVSASSTSTDSQNTFTSTSPATNLLYENPGPELVTVTITVPPPATSSPPPGSSSATVPQKPTVLRRASRRHNHHHQYHTRPISNTPFKPPSRPSHDEEQIDQTLSISHGLLILYLVLAAILFWIIYRCFLHSYLSSRRRRARGRKDTDCLPSFHIDDSGLEEWEVQCLQGGLRKRASRMALQGLEEGDGGGGIPRRRNSPEKTSTVAHLDADACEVQSWERAVV